MATHTSLVSLFTDIANAIRYKKGTTADISADDFPSEIMNIQTTIYGTDDSDATLTSGSSMLSGVTAYADGTKYTGSMTNNGAVSGTIDGLVSLSYTIPTGYHNGSGTVTLSNAIETALSQL